ncbi:hypothetical protein EYR40_002466 [Pleurotus pulmonarius]|nr:hypothetical protein EYR36_002029 [Pleurotus pulmonarius]KAF4583968.1 hypothetical protein EYR40_002466 [Pleurotus pulmonarius]KAF4588230.1 hypothetical protein EYR38_010197 [Pleurotus pulmonarius]
MFSKASLFFTAAVVIAAVGAAPTSATTEPTAGECNTGPIQCCDNVFGGITGLVGFGCSPILSIAGGPKCNTQTVCCTGNTFNGLFNIGCTPINLNL